MDKREELFTCLPLIEDVLRMHPGVDVVISSSWRFFHPLEQIGKRFCAAGDRLHAHLTP